MGNKYREQLEERIIDLQDSLDDDSIRYEFKERNQIIAWHLLETLQVMDNENLRKN